MVGLTLIGSPDLKELKELYTLHRFEEVIIGLEGKDELNDEMRSLKAFSYFNVHNYSSAITEGEKVVGESDSLNLMLAKSSIAYGDLERSEKYTALLPLNQERRNLEEVIETIKSKVEKLTARDLGSIDQCNGICYTIDGKILYAKGNKLVLDGKTIYESEGMYVGSPFIYGNEIYFVANVMKKESVVGSELNKVAKDRISKLQLFQGNIAGLNVTNVQRMKLSNIEYDYLSPYVDQDGNFFFSSNAVGGLGGFDIYRCDRLQGGGYEKPVNVGNPINTRFDDVYYRTDGNRIYYSTSLDGNGGLDLFATLEYEGKYLPMQNLGSKVNTSKSDYSLCINGSSAHFVSIVDQKEDHLKSIENLNLVKEISVTAYNKLSGDSIPVTRVRSNYENGFGDTLDYSEGRSTVLFPKDQLFDNYLVVESGGYETKSVVGPGTDTTLYFMPNYYGKVTDNITREDLSGVKVFLLEFGDTVARTVTDEEGEWWIAHDNDSEYDVVYEYPEYERLQWNTSEVPVEISSKYGMSIEAKKGNVLKIRNIYFELAKADLKEESKEVLDRIKIYLDENPNVRIELSAHTDSRGSNASNMTLSKERAAAAFTYLVDNGVSKDRLIPTGYGETKLTNECRDGIECSEEQHALNRRVEMKIL